MGKKNKNKSGHDAPGTGGAQQEQQESEQALQAVLLAIDHDDDSEGRGDNADGGGGGLMPLSLDCPSAVTPLNNVLMIDYALDFLASAGVQEVIVVCTSDKVEAHVKQQQQQQQQSGRNDEDGADNDDDDKKGDGGGQTPPSSSWCCSCTAIPSVTVFRDKLLCATAGDALRELDKRGAISSDPFVLMHADTVTNADLGAALRGHAVRQKKNPSAIMTMLLKPVTAAVANYRATSGGIRPANQELVVGLDSTQENRVLVYEERHYSDNKNNNNDPDDDDYGDDDDDDAIGPSSSVSVPCSFFHSHGGITLRTDLLNTGMYVCSPAVLARFSDEFDYLSITRQFVKNTVAEEEEGLQQCIHAHLLEGNEYAARVVDAATYGAVSRNLLQRWCYPVVPEHLPVGYEYHYRYKTLQARHYLYQECSNDSGGQNQPTVVGRSSSLVGPGMLGKRCAVGERCTIRGTVLGRGVRVGDDAVLEHCHVWNNVVIESGAVLVQAIIAHDCIVREGAVIGRGCVLGPGCVVGKGVVVPEFTRLTMAPEMQQDDFDDDWDDDDDDDNDNDNDAQKQHQEKQTSPDEQQPKIVCDAHVVGSDGQGRVWKSKSARSSSSSSPPSPPASPVDVTLMSTSMGFDPRPLYLERYKLQQDLDQDQWSDQDGQGDGDAVNDDDDGAFMYGDDDAAGVTFVRGGNEGGDDDAAAAGLIVGRQKGVNVVQVLQSICMEYEPSSETSSIENLAIELNSFKFSQNASYSDCTMAAMMAVLDKMNVASTTTDGKLVSEFKSQLEHWAPLFRKMSIGTEEEKAILLGLETKALATDEDIGKVLSTGASFRFLLQTLHDQDIVREEAILEWAAERRQEQQEQQEQQQGGGDNEAVVSARIKLFQLQPVQDFLEWLEEEEDDDDDEEDSSEGD